MQLHVTTTTYGRPALEALAELVGEHKQDDPLAPLTVVVPTNGVGVSARRWLARAGNGIAGLSIVTTYRLAELLGAPALAAKGRRPVSTPVLAAAVRQVLRRAPGRFVEVVGHASTAEALVRVHAELSHCPADSLDVIAEQGPRPADVVRIHRSVRDLLAAWYDERDLLESARVAVDTGSPILDDLGSLVVFLPQDLSLAACALLTALAQRAPVTVLAGLTGAQDADADVVRTLDRLGLHVEPAMRARGGRPRIVSVSDADEEARSAVDEVVTAARGGMPLERIAILYPSEVPHAHILREHLEGAGIIWNGRGVTPLKGRMAGRWVLDLLELREHGFSRTAVMHVLTSALVRTNGRPIPLTAWERASRDAGVVAGREHWDTRLAAHAVTLRGKADTEASSEEPRPWLVDKLRRLADEADALRAYVVPFVDDVRSLADLDSWSELASATRTLVERHLGREHERSRWPDDELQAAQKVDHALDRLAALDSVEPAANVSLFHHTLELELDADLGRHGRSGVGVMVGPYSHGLGADLDLVVLLGLAEGVAPTRPGEDPLLLDREREPARDVLRLRSDSIGVQHRHFLAGLAATTNDAVLVVPRGDLRRSIERAPSRWLLDEVELHTGTRTLAAAGPIEVGSYAGRVRSLAFPATAQLHHLNTLALPAGTHDHADPDSVAWERGVDLLAARRSNAFTRFDGNLTHLDATLIGRFRDGRQIAPTRLENYSACPHGHLVEHVLGVKRIEDPEELLAMSPMERGNVVHRVLERWLEAELEIGVPPSRARWSPKAEERLLAIAEEECDAAEAQGLTGHPVLWARDRHRILHDLRLFLVDDNRERAANGTTPRRPELAFGLDGRDPVTLHLGDGSQVRFRGKIDRVDQAADETLRVYDYKTGSARDYARLSEEDPDNAGTHLQLPVYALAARQAFGEAETSVYAEYWFNSTKGEFSHKGFIVTGAVIERFRHVVTTLVDSFEAGLFPLHPQEPGFRVFNACWYCDPDEPGTTDTHARWLALRTQPELADLVGLIEPGALEVDA